MSAVKSMQGSVDSIQTPGFIKGLLGSIKLSWLWLFLRIYIGYEWVVAGYGKITSPVWTGSKAGVALTGFIQGALAKTTGDHPDVRLFYGWFLQHVVLPNVKIFSILVAWGEVLVGIALILGLFTVVASFFSGFMNLNYMLAGTMSINATMFVGAVILLAAWRTAGWLGLDHWLLPRLSKIWTPKTAAQVGTVSAAGTPSQA